MDDAIVMVLMNHKGGVGKTTVATNLAHGLALRGKKVLVIDHDAQCNSTYILLPKDVPVAEISTLYDLYKPGGTTDVHECIHTTRFDNVHILPNRQKIAMLEDGLVESKKTSQFLAKKIIDEIRGDYDFIIFDTPPTLNFWVTTTLKAAHFVIVPIEAGSKFALEGLSGAIEAIEAIAMTANPQLRFLRLLINKVDLRTTATKVSVEYINAKFGKDKTFATCIPDNTMVKQAEMLRTTVLRHAAGSKASAKYKELVEELLTILDAEQYKLGV